MSRLAATILLVSEDAALRDRTRKELETRCQGMRIAAVSNLDSAWRVAKRASPDVIVLEDASDVSSGKEPRSPRLCSTVSSLASYAPVVVIGAPEHRCELSALLSAGAADYVERSEECWPRALAHIERHLQHRQNLGQHLESLSSQGDEDFGEVLRHELNNPLTGILGNAELLLAEIRRKNDGRLPQGGLQRVETIAALAVRLRETVRRLSLEWQQRATTR